jgi:hypothetical protein
MIDPPFQLSTNESGSSPLHQVKSEPSRCRVIFLTLRIGLWLGRYRLGQSSIKTPALGRREKLGECFEVYWRGKDHPQLAMLPPLQIEMNED